MMWCKINKELIQMFFVLFVYNVFHLNIDPVLKRLADRLAAIGDGADI